MKVKLFSIKLKKEGGPGDEEKEIEKEINEFLAEAGTIHHVVQSSVYMELRHEVGMRTQIAIFYEEKVKDLTTE